MCTISIVPVGTGFRVMSNRDERRDRAVASQPRFETLGLRTAIMPIDPTGGGSWIGANDRGLVATILNRHGVRPLPSASFTSRGAIVRQALACDSVEAAVESVRTLEATRFRPFRLVLAQKSQLALVVGNGHEIAHVESTLEQPYMFTASSLGDIFVDSPRRRLFECLMEHVGEWLDGQRLFHRHQWPDKREISVLMDREDATTVSRTIVDVGPAGIALEYESLVPFSPAHRLELPS
jgi:hypothetical protein